MMISISHIKNMNTSGFLKLLHLINFFYISKFVISLRDIIYIIHDCLRVANEINIIILSV